MNTTLFKTHLLALAMAFTSQCSAQPNIEPAEVSEDLAADFETLYKQWKTDKNSFQQVINQSQIEIDPLKQIELKRQFYEKQKDLVQRIPIVTDAARAKWVLEPNASPNAYKWLRDFCLMDASLSKDANVVLLAKTLLTHKDLIPKTDLADIYRVAARCAFHVNDFERCQQYLDSLQELEPLGKFLRDLQNLVNDSSQMWTQEQLRRENDSATGNLPLVAIQTSSGLIVIELFADDCPEVVAGFIELAESGYYGGHELARTDDRSLADWRISDSSTTGPQIPTLRKVSQTGDRGQFRGSLTLLKARDNADCSQFAITLSAPLRQYSNRIAIGRVVKGEEVLAAIQSATIKELETLGRITKVQIVRQSKPESSIAE